MIQNRSSGITSAKSYIVEAVEIHDHVRDLLWMLIGVRMPHEEFEYQGAIRGERYYRAISLLTEA